MPNDCSRAQIVPLKKPHDSNICRLVERNTRLYAFKFDKMFFSVEALLFPDKLRFCHHCEVMRNQNLHECSCTNKYCNPAEVVSQTVNHLVKTMNRYPVKMRSIVCPQIWSALLYASLIHQVNMLHHVYWIFPTCASPASTKMNIVEYKPGQLFPPQQLRHRHLIKQMRPWY